MKINVSSRLMDNFITGSNALISSNKPFKAIYGLKGHSNIFSIGEDGGFYLTREEENSSTGWNQVNLSQELSEQVFKKEALEILSFDVRQEALGKSIVVAIVRSEEKDYLYKGIYSEAVKNEEGIEKIKHHIAWKEIPFDYQSNYPAMKEVILSASSPHALVSFDDKGALGRFKVSLNAKAKRWIMCNFGVEYTKTGVQTLFGKAYDSDPGAYTLGENRLVYQPLKKGRRQDAIIPLVQRLYIDKGHTPSAMALFKQVYDDDENVTTLFVASKEGGLFCFTPEQVEEDNEDQGQLCFEDDWLLKDCKALYAEILNNVVTVWIENGSGELSYATCPLASLTDANAWQKSVPILAEVEQVQFYVNPIDTTNTIFAHTGGNQLVKLEKDGSGNNWIERNIVLPRAAMDEEVEVKTINSQTIQVTVTDEEDRPLPFQEIYINSSSRASYLVNNEYKVLGPQRTTVVSTDETGAISIIEPVEGLSANQLTFKSASDGKAIATADANQEAFDKMMKLDDVNKLKSAKVDEGDGQTSQLIPEGTNEDDLKQVAESITALKTVVEEESPGLSQNSLKNSKETIIAYNPNLRNLDKVESFSNSSLEMVDSSFFKNIKSGFSDAVRYIDTLIKRAKRFVVKIGELIVDGVRKGVRIVLEVGEKLIEFVADTVRSVVDVVGKIWETIKVAAKKIWDFIKFLFNWKDIQRTKEVLKESIKDFIDSHVIGGLETAKKDVHHFFDEVKEEIHRFRQEHFQDLSDQKVSLATPSGEAGQHLGVVNSSESKFLSNHLQNNYKEESLPQFEMVELDEAPNSLLDCLGELTQELGKQIFEGSLNPRKLADKFFELLELLTDLAQEAVDKVMEVLISFASKIFDLMDEPIKIPVVSDLLEKYLGLPEFSFLDIVCYVAAIPTTILYKVITNKAPVKSDESWETISKAIPQARLTKEPTRGMKFSAEEFALYQSKNHPGYIVKDSLEWYAILRIASGILRVGQFGDLLYLHNNIGGINYGKKSPFKTLGTILKLVSEIFDLTAKTLFAKVTYNDNILEGIFWKGITGIFGLLKLICYLVKFISLGDNRYTKFNIDRGVTNIRCFPAAFEVIEFFVAFITITKSSSKISTTTNVALNARNFGRLGNAGYNLLKTYVHFTKAIEPTVLTVMAVCIGLDMGGRITEGAIILIDQKKNLPDINIVG